MAYVLEFDPADTPRFARKGCGTYQIAHADGGPPVSRGVTRSFRETLSEASRWNGAAIVTGRRAFDGAFAAAFEGLPDDPKSLKAFRTWAKASRTAQEA
jgi:hypothetical protein